MINVYPKCHIYPISGLQIPPGYAIIHALRKANEGVHKERAKLGRKMAVSVSVVYVRDRVMYFTHLGDSRIYCLQDGKLNQLTRDHTLKEEDGFEKDRFSDPRLMKALTEGLGIHQLPSIKVKKFPLRQKDLILMTTEGLTTHVSNREILDLSSKAKDPEKLCNQLIDLASKKGGDGTERPTHKKTHLSYTRIAQILQNQNWLTV